MSVFVLGDRREDGGRQSGRKEGLRGGGGGQGSEGKRLKEGDKRKRPRGSTLVPKVRQPGASPTGMPYDKPPPLQAQVSPSKSLTVVGAQHAGHVSPWTKEQTRVSVRQTPMGSCQEFEVGGARWQKFRERVWRVPARYDHTGQNPNVEPGAGGTVAEP